MEYPPRLDPVRRRRMRRVRIAVVTVMLIGLALFVSLNAYEHYEIADAAEWSMNR
jgi:hypothetical protein